MDSDDSPIAQASNGIAGFTEPSASWRKNLQNWQLILRTLEDDGGAVLWEQLSPVQRSSLRILDEWWKGAKEENPIQSWARTMTGPFPDFKSVQQGYTRSMVNLWRREFGPAEPVYASALLRTTREFAAIHAAANRLATAAYLDMSLQQESALGDADGGSKAMNLVTEIPIPAILRSCPWLSRSQMSGFPHYLWDTVTKATVELPSHDSEYVAISHTWGRWKIDGPGCKVEGVPWMVPRNTIFGVQDLPAKLSSLPFSARYVWFDLVCIPQDPADARLQGIQKVEIANQAAIFASAKWATVWFNRISCWKGLLGSIRWLSLHYLENRGLQDLDTKHWLTRIKEQMRSTNLATLTSVNESDFGHNDTISLIVNDLDGWFTSLWTLQETCLRPDMFLCDRDWGLLKMETKFHPITLESLISLVVLTAYDYDLNISPQNVQELRGVFGESGVANLLNMSPISIIVHGNKRTCTDHQRAIAIMSALGCTEWYQEQRLLSNPSQNPAPGTTDPFIGNKYPLEFIREVLTKFGATFYSAYNKATLANGFDLSSLRGTMLPFGIDGVLVPEISAMDFRGIEDHPSVGTWTLEMDGSVLIPSAGVLMSWPDGQLEVPIDAKVNAVSAGAATHEILDVQGWMGSFRPNVEKHAIFLLRQLGGLYLGIIVERVSLADTDPTFVKIGSFYTKSSAYALRVRFESEPQHMLGWKVL